MSWRSSGRRDDRRMGRLSSGQITRFKEEGYLLLPDFIAPAVFQPLIHEFEAIIDARARQAQREGRLAERFEGEPFERRLASVYANLKDPDDLWRAVHGK